LDEIQTKAFRVFLLAIHSHLYSFALRVIFLQTLATSYSFYSSVTVQYTEKEKDGKPGSKIYPLPYGLRNPNRNLKYSEDYVQKPQRNCRFMNSASDESVWNLFTIRARKRNLGSKKSTLHILNSNYTQSPETDFIRMI
jgi:hypothetical protein